MRTKLPRFAFATLAAFLLPSLSTEGPSARADEGAAAQQDPQVARLLQAKRSLNWNYTPPGRSDRYGHAETLVDAPADKVAKAMTEFGKYKELHRKFATARVINKEGDKTDVYMRYPVQIGLMKIEFWEVMRFEPVKQSGSAHVLEATGIKGDMKRGHAVMTVKPVDATHSLLQVDILLIPSVPAPQFLIDEELRDGALDFVNGLRDRAQRSFVAMTSP